MSDLLPIESEGSKPAKRSRSRKSKSASKEKAVRPEPTRPGNRQILDTDDCLQALSQLPGLTAMGLLGTPQVNAMRGIYQTILQHHQKTQAQRSEQPLSETTIQDLIREQPELLSVLEPLLTDEQINLIMKNARDGDEEG
jgi:hypothetical protein